MADSDTKEKTLPDPEAEARLAKIPGLARAGLMAMVRVAQRHGLKPDELVLLATTLHGMALGRVWRDDVDNVLPGHIDTLTSIARHAAKNEPPLALTPQEAQDTGLIGPDGKPLKGVRQKFEDLPPEVRAVAEQLRERLKQQGIDVDGFEVVAMSPEEFQKATGMDVTAMETQTQGGFSVGDLVNVIDPINGTQLDSGATILGFPTPAKAIVQSGKDGAGNYPCGMDFLQKVTRQ